MKRSAVMYAIISRIDNDQDLSLLKSQKLKKKLFERCVEDIYLSEGPDILRLEAWLEFLNDHVYQSGLKSFDLVIEGLVNIWMKTDVLQHQSYKEFEKTKEYLLLFCNNGNLKRLGEEETFRTLIILCAALSRFYRVSLTVFREEVKLLSGLVVQSDISQLFCRIYKQQNSPEYFLQHLHALSNNDLNLFIKSILKLNRNITSKNDRHKEWEVQELLELRKIQVKYTDHIITRGRIIFLLAQDFVFEKEARLFAECSEEYQNTPLLYLSNIDFWKKAFDLSINGTSFMPTASLVCYLEGHLNREKHASFFIQHSFESLTNQIEDSLGGCFTPKGFVNTPRIWDKSGLEEGEFIVNDTKYILTELTTWNDLLEEHNSLNHYIICHVGACAKGKLSFWSLRSWNEIEKKNIPVCTLEVVGEYVEKIRCMDNSAPDLVIKEIIQIWVDKNRLILQ